MAEKTRGSGTVYLAVELELEAESGREKHTDPQEQGNWLALGFANFARQNLGDDAKVAAVHYYGTTAPGPGVEPVQTF